MQITSVDNFGPSTKKSLLGTKKGPLFLKKGTKKGPKNPFFLKKRDPASLKFEKLLYSILVEMMIF